jgi:molecular chaperone GrpE
VSDTDPKVRTEPIQEEYSNPPDERSAGKDHATRTDSPDPNQGDQANGDHREDEDIQTPGPGWNELPEAQKVSKVVELAQRAAPESDDPLQGLEKVAEERDRYKDQMMRAVADLENYKKKAIRERSELLKYRNEDLLRELLPVVDNMERALAHCDADSQKDPLAEGVCMILDMLRKTLEKFGVQPISALGEEFDPSVHEALTQVPTPNEPPNKVMEEVEKGYMYNDRLLRPSKVVVSTRPESQ